LDPEAGDDSAAAMRRYVELTGAGGVHPDVVANLLESLLLYDRIAYREDVLSGASYLETVQNEDGSWSSRWYTGPYYGTYRALSVIAQVAPASAAIERAVAFTLTTQRDDGSWGDGDDPLATAFALLVLVAAGRTESQAHSRGVAWLRAHQESDGSWPERPFIEFPHPGGQSVERYGHRVVTTAFALKALCAGQAFTGAVALSTSESARVAPDVSYGGWK
jgi:squalene-hopene/tetraprenyl-beta-curcumene cyclase